MLLFRNVTKNLVELQSRMVSLMEAQRRNLKDLVNSAEKRTAVRIANARAAGAEEVAEARDQVIHEIQDGRGSHLYEVAMDSPVCVVGSKFLEEEMRTSEYGSWSNNEVASNNNDEAASNNNRSSTPKVDRLVESYYDAVEEVKALTAEVEKSTEVLTVRAKLAREIKNEE